MQRGVVEWGAWAHILLGLPDRDRLLPCRLWQQHVHIVSGRQLRHLSRLSHLHALSPQHVLYGGRSVFSLHVRALCCRIRQRLRPGILYWLRPRQV